MVIYTCKHIIEKLYIQIPIYLNRLSYHFYVHSFQNDTILEEMVDDKSTIENKINYGPDKRNQAIKLLVEVLEKGLKDRIIRLSILPNKYKEWECTDDAPNDIGKIIIGFELNPKTWFNIVDKGPEANLADVIKIIIIV